MSKYVAWLPPRSKEESGQNEWWPLNRPGMFAAITIASSDQNRLYARVGRDSSLLFVLECLNRIKCDSKYILNVLCFTEGNILITLLFLQQYNQVAGLKLIQNCETSRNFINALIILFCLNCLFHVYTYRCTNTHMYVYMYICLFMYVYNTIFTLPSLFQSLII